MSRMLLAAAGGALLGATLACSSGADASAPPSGDDHDEKVYTLSVDPDKDGIQVSDFTSSWGKRCTAVVEQMDSANGNATATSVTCEWEAR